MMSKPRKPWWLPSRFTQGMLVMALCGVGLLYLWKALDHGHGGDAAGQGLATAFENLFLLAGVVLIAAVVLIVQLFRHPPRHVLTRIGVGLVGVGVLVFLAKILIF